MSSHFTVGMDIGGTNTDIGVVASDGHILSRKRVPTTDFTSVDAYLDALAEVVAKMLQEQQLASVAGIGVGVPNGNYYTGTVDYAPNLPFKGRIELRKLLAQRCNVPVVITNDANAAAYGEKVYGGAKEMNDFILITLGTGVGSGIVVNGRLLYGSDGFAGELGHCTLIPDGRLCSCGNRGCLEEYASARGICQNFNELRSKSTLNSLLDGQEVDCEKLSKAADAGDVLAQQAWAITGHYLGIALANAVAFTSPQAIFLMGGPVKAGHWLLNPTRQSLHEHLLPFFKNKVALLTSKLPANDVAILGAAALVNQL